MKILVVAKYYPKAAETFILEQVNSLVELGHDVEVLVLLQSDPSAFDERSIHNRLPERIIDGTIFFVPLVNRLLPTVRGVFRAVIKYPNALNVPRHGAQVTRGQVPAVIDQIGPLGAYDVIYCAFGQSGVIAECLRDSGLVAGPIVTNFLGYDVTQVIKQYGPEHYQRLFRFGSLFLPNSNYLRRRLLECGASEEKTTLHRLGVDVDRFSFVDRSGRTSVPRVVAVGRLVEKKGFEFFLRALAIMKDAGSEFEATVVGDGPLRSRLKALQEDLGLGDRLTFAGWCRPEEVQRHLEAADINVVPSVVAESGDEEGLPLTIVEAAARGLPTVGTIHSGIPEIVRDGETGLLVAERNASALAEAITSLCSSSADRIMLGRTARALVEHDFNATKQGQRLSELLSETAEGRF